jgi:hypothetical protein
MTTERSDALYKSWRESTEKFDYFMLGILGALCAYLTQGYKPDRIGLNPGTVEFVALLVLVLAAVLGFRRIEATNQATIINQRVLHANERRGVLTAIMHNGPKFNIQTGQSYSPEYAASQMPVLNSQIQSLEAQLERAEGKAFVSYRGRNVLTLVGFMLLLAGKIYSAYA